MDIVNWYRSIRSNVLSRNPSIFPIPHLKACSFFPESKKQRGFGAVIKIQFHLPNVANPALGTGETRGRFVGSWRRGFGIQGLVLTRELENIGYKTISPQLLCYSIRKDLQCMIVEI